LPKNKDVYAGLLFMVFGAMVLILGHSLPKFADGEIGSGGFPLIIGVLLGLFGCLTILTSLSSPETLTATREELRAVVFVVAGAVAFGLLIRPLGLFFSVMALVVVSAFANRQVKPLRVFLIGIGLTAMSWIIFVMFLQMPVRLINPSLLGG
jgi:uncharacterized protein YybS (DUF2232 family)